MGYLIVAAAIVAFAVAILAVDLRRLRETTLLAPTIWALVSLAALVIDQAVILRVPMWKLTRAKFDLIAATSTLLPFMALVGAKRPQNRAWQWIVLTFWLIAAWPALESLVAHYDDRMEIHPLWGAMYAIVIVAGLANYLPTRFWPVALVAAVGQWALLAGGALPGGWQMFDGLRSYVTDEILPEVAVNGRYDHRMWQIAVGIVPWAAAACVAHIIPRRRKPFALMDSGWNCAWMEFRNWYGLLWSMRIVERMQVLLHGTGRHFDWRGFASVPAHDVGDQKSENIPQAAASDSADSSESAFRNLLLRFVSSEWIERQLAR